MITNVQQLMSDIEDEYFLASAYRQANLLLGDIDEDPDTSVELKDTMDVYCRSHS